MSLIYWVGNTKIDAKLVLSKHGILSRSSLKFVVVLIFLPSGLALKKPFRFVLSSHSIFFLLKFCFLEDKIEATY